MNVFQSLMLLLVAYLVILLLIFVRPVGAEDDCEMGTYAVTRLPVLELVCVWE